MNKSDLIDGILTKTDLPRRCVEEAVGMVFDSMADALARDERIEIRGFGSFIAKPYRARLGRNPRTGESIDVPAKRLPFFKVGKDLRERVNAVDYGDKIKSSDAPDD